MLGEFTGLVIGDEEGDVPADGFGRGPAVKGLGRRVPARDHSVEAHRDDGVVGRLHDGRQVGGGPRGGPPGTPALGLADFALDRRGQPDEVVLEDVVAGRGPHHGDRDVLADGPREDDEREVRVESADDRQGGRCAESGQGVVRDDGVPRPVGQGRAQPVDRLHPLPCRLQAAPAERLENKFFIMRSPDNYQAEWECHAGYPFDWACDSIAE